MNSGKLQRPVVQRARQAEAVVHEHRLARAVALVHAADLRDGGVAFIDHEQEIVREEVEQRERPRAGRAPAEVPRVVFDPAAEAHLLHHLEVVFRAHLDALRLEQLPVLFEDDDPLIQLLADRRRSPCAACRRRHELLRRIERDQSSS